MGRPTKRRVEKRVAEVEEEVRRSFSPAEEPESRYVEVDDEEWHWTAMYVPRELWAAPDESTTDAWEYLQTEGRSHPELRAEHGPPSISPTRAFILSLRLLKDHSEPLAKVARDTSAESESVGGDEDGSTATAAEVVSDAETAESKEDGDDAAGVSGTLS